ncbi:ABC transporter permease [Paenibacillus paeoniae]|uniref:ABC transporter permease n=1 Tax=Paenibacillus paeoniae TaxID=2292705 RepID=A0A371PEA2_9BACL|nr:ABC transporter permease [Paenibacillus paeoniae]REK74237.1 ABC transporter permease [Paenibacillus paeoniae]
MKKLTINFLKADLRMPHLMFWDWMFPLILIIAFSLFVKSQEFSSFLLPGFVSLFILQSIIFSLPYRLAQYREQGILDLISKKGSPTKLLTGFYLSRIVILVIQTALVIVLGTFSLGVTLDVNGVMLLASLAISILLFLLLGSLCGWIVKSQNSALGLAQAVYFWLLGTSGIFYPIEKSPEFLKILAQISPLYYVNNLWSHALVRQEIDILGNAGASGIFLILFLAVLAVLVKGIKKGGPKHETVAQVEK